jgi:hypothetical protein
MIFQAQSLGQKLSLETKQNGKVALSQVPRRTTIVSVLLKVIVF